MESVQLDNRVVAAGISEIPCEDEGESECDLMIESLKRELDIVRSQLEAVVSQLTDAPVSKNNGFPTPGAEQASTLVQPGTAVVRPAIIRSVKKKPPQVSPENRQHYLSVIDDIEKEQQETKKRCLQLMELHISNQLKRLQSAEKKLSKSLQKRLEKEKASRLARRPIMTRSKIPDSTLDAKYYKSSFYKAASLEYEICRRSAQKRLLKKKPPKIVVTGSSQQELAEEEEEGEPSNSWAVTAGASGGHDNTNKQPVKTKDDPVFKPTASKPPEFIPLSAFFRNGSIRETIEAQYHEARIRKLTNTQQCMKHMYKLAKSHQNQMMQYDHTIPYDAKLFPSATLLDIPHTTQCLSRSSHSPKHLDSTSKRQDLSLPSLKINSSDGNLSSRLFSESPKSEDTPLLSMDEALSSGRTKEARALSTKWNNYLKNLEMSTASS